MKVWFKIFLIIGITALVYFHSFTSPFFQDDFLLLQLSKGSNFFMPIANFPYRPIAIGGFYYFGRLLFESNVIGFHLLEFFFFAFTLFAIYFLANKLFKDKKKSLLAVFFYALNISLFANFYWVATSYFSLGMVFFLMAVICYLENKNFFLYFFAVLTILTNELAFVLPGIFFILNWYFKSWPKKFWIFTVFDLVLIVGRTMVAGLPTVSDYALKFNFSVISNFRWYALRALNLPEGVNRTTDLFIWASFAIFILAIILRIKNVNIKVLVLGISWFIVGALPFYFLPGHMSSYYLTFALVGPSIIFADIFSRTKIAYLAAAAYLFLTIFGLRFLSKTHWIILKNAGL